MRLILVATLGFVAAIWQLGAAPLAFAPGTAPLLPVALLAAWATLRTPAEAWPALLTSGVALGVASSERVGWFLLALLPAALAGALVATAPPAHRLALAPLLGGAAAVAYVALLAMAGGHAGLLTSRPLDLLAAAALTALCTAVAALACWPFRLRQARLFP